MKKCSYIIENFTILLATDVGYELATLAGGNGNAELGRSGRRAELGLSCRRAVLGRSGRRAELGLSGKRTELGLFLMNPVLVLYCRESGCVLDASVMVGLSELHWEF